MSRKMKMIYPTLIQQFMLLLAIASSTSAYISIVTGANGFVGRHVVYSLLQQHNTPGDGKDGDEKKEGEQIIVCLVRPEKVAYEESYWDAHLMDMQQSSSSSQKLCVKVMPYDMLDNGLTLNNALEAAAATEEENGTSLCDPICIYHIASVFGPTPDPIQTAHDNVQSAEDVVRTLDTFHRRHTSLRSSRLVLTSSMAAVRATDQTPLNGKHYTHRDWNTLSKLNSENWGSCYQWSKAESERRAWELVRECNERYANENANANEDGKSSSDDDDGNSNQIEMIALCPSFVFGPPPPMPSKMMNDATHKNTKAASSSSFSLTLIDQWLRGKSPVQSRLCGDVRDVAMAHVVAGTMRTLPKDNADRRYILSTEERLSSESTANALIRGVERASQKRHKGGEIDIDMSKITCDTQFTGGAIEIGDREVEASERAERDLGVVFRPVEETMRDMAESLLDSM